MIVFEVRCFEQLQGLHSESSAAEYGAAGPVQKMICNSHYYMNFCKISKEKRTKKSNVAANSSNRSGYYNLSKSRSPSSFKFSIQRGNEP